MPRRLGLGAMAMACGLGACMAPPAAPVAPKVAPTVAPTVAQDPAALGDPDVGSLPDPGRTLSGVVPMLGRDIALPDGAWIVLARQRTVFAGGYPPGAAVILARRDGNALGALLSIAGNAATRPAAHGWPLNPVCRAAPPAPGLAVAGGRQDCMVVTTQSTAHWGQRDAPLLRQATATSLSTAGLALPPVLVLVAVAAADATGRLTEQLWLPPAADRTTQAAALATWAQGWRGVVQADLHPHTAAAPVARIP